MELCQFINLCKGGKREHEERLGAATVQGVRDELYAMRTLVPGCRLEQIVASCTSGKCLGRAYLQSKWSMRRERRHIYIYT